MLETIRNRAQSWIAKVILVLITIPFALWGIESYFTGGGQEKPVATIDDMAIGQSEFFQALQDEKEGLEAQMGGKVDIDNPAFRQQVLDRLVDIQLLGNAAGSAGFHISEAQINAMLAGAPAFQDNGKFSEARLDQWLRSRGMSRQGLINMVRQDLLLRQLQFGYGEGALVSGKSGEQMARLLGQRRVVNEAVFSVRDYGAGVRIDEAAVTAAYQARQQDFAVPAQVRLQYVVLTQDALAGGAIGEAAAREFYERNIARYQTPEQRRASHILIKTEAGMSAEARAAAKAKAEKLRQEAKANPARFAALARENSDDPGSGAQGGDLGLFAHGMMVKPFADAAFALRVGEVSEVVESEFGYHVIRLDAIQPGAKRPFAAVKNEIVADLRQQEAQRRFADAAERFSNLVYEQPDSLQPAAAEFKLRVEESDWISRERAQPELLRHARLLDAVFAPEALEKKQNSEAIEVRPGTLVAARVIAHQPAGVRPLAEVAALIRADLTEKAASEQAIAAGKAALAAAQAGQTPARLSAPMTVSRMQPMNLPPEAIKAIFKAGVASLPAFVGVESGGAYRLYRINAVEEAAANDVQAQLVSRDLSRLTAQEELRTYLEYQRAQARIDINREVVERRAE